jgi:two-component system sensor histidine kinase RegB
MARYYALNLLAQRLSLLRSVGIVLVALLLLLAQELTLALAYPNLVMITFAWLIMHGGILILQPHRQITEQNLLLQLSSDLLVLAALLAFSGGVHNPFFAFLLLPLLLSVGILSRSSQWILLGLVLMLASLLVWFPLSGVQGIPNLSPEVYRVLLILEGAQVKDTPFNPRDSLAKLGIWLNISLIAVLVAVMMAKLHQRLQEQELALERAYRQSQEQAHLLQLGLTAAATAHELATPLATISLLASEAKDAYQFDEPEQAEIALEHIQSLVMTCKTHITKGLSQQGATELPIQVPCVDYLKQQITYWQNIRPQASATLVIADTQQKSPTDMPQIQADPVLGQLLTSLLNNAADASPQACQIVLSWNRKQIKISIRDTGSGFSPETLANFPAPQISQMAEGHGIGLSLAYYQAQQLGGSLGLHNLPTGAEVMLSLPNRSQDDK